jgi:Zn-dependent protease
MPASAPASWSLRLGRWRGVELRVHVHFPLLALAVLFLASQPNGFSDRIPTFPSPVAAALMGLGVLLGSVMIHELVRAAIAERVGGRTNLIVLGQTGGWAHPQLPPDPPAHLVTAMSGPLTYLALVVAGGCALAVADEQNLIKLFSLFAPEFTNSTSTLRLAAELIVWINGCLLLVNLLPVYPCDGADLLRSVLWPLVGRSSAAAATTHVAYVGAAVAALLALVLQRHEVSGVPAWFPLAVISVLMLYGGNRAARQRQHEDGLAIDELESDDEQWLGGEWIEEERAAVLVEQLQERQQETLDRKRREREDREDARVDDILARMQDIGFDQLSEEEQAVLKRASRRYRQRRRPADGGEAKR